MTKGGYVEEEEEEDPLGSPSEQGLACMARSTAGLRGGDLQGEKEVLAGRG
jgi:hypothetical protein